MNTMVTAKAAIQANLPWNANIDWDGEEALVLVKTVEAYGSTSHRVMVDSPAEAYDLKYKIATKGIYHGLRVTGFAA